MANTNQLLLKSGLEPDTIEVRVDKDSDFVKDGTTDNGLMQMFGTAYPLVKVNDKVIPSGDIQSLNVDVTMFELPSFSFTLLDSYYEIRDSLKSTKTDTCTIFIGANNLYVKFNGLITSISDFGSTIYCTGILWDKSWDKTLFGTKQQIWNDTKIIDIIKEICEQSKLGLLVYDNADLQKTIDVCINPGLRQLDFIKFLVETYTDNLFVIDTYGVLHIGSVNSIKKQPVDNMTYDYNRIGFGSDSKLMPIESGPKPITFTNLSQEFSKTDEPSEKEHYWKLRTDSLSISNYVNGSKIVYKDVYKTRYDKEEQGNKQDQVVNSINQENTFSEWNNHKFPYNQTKINKAALDISVSFNLQIPCFEILPFTRVNMELYKLQTLETTEDNTYKIELNDELSGKRIVSNYGFRYIKLHNNSGLSKNQITQNIKLLS